MRKIIVFIISLCILLLSSCVNNKSMTRASRTALNRIIDGYTSHYYESPSSVEEIVAFCQENRNMWCGEPYAKSIETTLSCLNQNKEQILFFQNLDDFNNESFLILYKEDTLLYRIDKCFFPCITNMIYGYRKSYLEYPSSIQELAIYDSITKVRQELDYKRCCDAGVRKLEKYHDKITWSRKGKELLIMISNDTIGYWGEYVPCDISATDIHLMEPRFYKDNGTFVLTTGEMIKQFKKDIRQLGLKHNNDNERGNNNWHILKFTKKEGLHPFCENDDIKMETGWFHELSSYVERFAYEHDFGKIIFVSKIFDTL